ncbi:MBL fold metallo-hydrolase [Streptomyces sp. WAC 06738]|uniref:MBL fold metallo-hydrolase n=1 Tax=Streptomyces sp. WAC 06738 TaxID=2203210 RepID=UPI000F710D90|nr:MBL fold metallo-hydrolase [Streptomyces sp. WAC 06738]AZM48879.1 MBL fold metallo-hydrolase [Streptomyces sp. WAC 06738]
MAEAVPGLVRITDRVWWWPHHPDPDRVQAGVGVIAGDDGCLLVDAGHSPALARRIAGALGGAGLPKARALVYTHHHWDHVWGAQEWAVPVTAHELTAEALRAEAEKPWSEAYVRAGMARDPRLVPSYTARLRAMAEDGWDSLRIVPPAETFTGRHEIRLGGVTAELRHVGGGHAADSTVVGVPSEGVLFVGDCYYPPPYHLREEGAGPDLALARELVGGEYEWYVESHEAPRRRKEAEAALGG